MNVGPFTFDDPDDDDLGPWTISDAEHNDVANIYSDENATVKITRETSIATAKLFAAAPNMKAVIDEIYAMHLGDCPASMDEATFAKAHIARIRRLAWIAGGRL